MKCPNCKAGASDYKVIASYTTSNGDYTRQRRCNICGYKDKYIEVPYSRYGLDRDLLLAIKHDFGVYIEKRKVLISKIKEEMESKED